ncbi:TIGR03808 family TAT-translocated repetitive protein [Alsobacter sp. SYSU BS001988]
MSMTRRRFVGAAPCVIALPVAAGLPSGAFAQAALDASSMGLKPETPGAGPALARLAGEAARRGLPLFLAPGRYRVGPAQLPEGAALVGGAGLVRLVSDQPGAILTARGIRRLSLAGLTLEGAGGRSQAPPLIDLDDVASLSLLDCEILASPSTGAKLNRCGGRVERCRIAGAADAGLFSMDGQRMLIRDNVVEGCGNNGVLVWRSQLGDDATLVDGNRISRIRTDAGGTGQNGNAIGLYRASNVIVRGNVVRDCALSAVRNNGGAGVQMIGNSCVGLGETALYQEFGFAGAVVAQNVVEDASTGISLTNLDQGGRGAACTGNVLRRIRRRPLPYGAEAGGGIAIHAEGDAAIAGNVIEDVDRIAIRIGWGKFLRNVAVTGNSIRRSPVGIAVSVAEGAGPALVGGNVLSETRDGAVVGFDHDRAVTGDLTKPGQKLPPGIRIEANAAS